MKKIKRTFIAIVIFMALVVVAPAGFYVFAEAEMPEKGDTITDNLDEETYETSTPLDNDVLFENYVEDRLSIKSTSTESKSRGSRLTGLNKTIYNLLRPEIKKTADGERVSTAFEITVADLGLSDKKWTAEDLGVDAIVEDGAITKTASEALSEKLNIRTDLIVRALLADCPYDLYWFDKVGGVSKDGPGITVTFDGTEWKLRLSKGITFSFAVAQSYSNGEYTLNTTNTERVQHAVSKAADIVEEYKNKTDYEKLVDYKRIICDLVSYDSAVASDGSTPYGDSWQIISVFDENTDTNVVCEGYSKAFQYLCDLTTFEGDISCISVTGTMSGGTGAGAHMWNIVNMEDNGNYLVDVTNCDEDTVGYPDLLFLAGYSTNNENEEYGFSCSGSTILYTYDPDTIEAFDSDELAISEESYEYHDPRLWTTYKAKSFIGGNGTESNPYEISCGEELALFSHYVNNNIDQYADAYYELTADIDLGEHQWVPIGGNPLAGEYTVFKGHFNGNNHTIKNMKIGEECSRYYIGLFGVVHNGVVENLRIEDASARINNTYTFVMGFTFEGAIFVGAISGEIANSEIHNCSIVNMDYSAQSNAAVILGGIAGYIVEGTVTESSVTGTAILVADKAVDGGGLFGDCFNTSISKCSFRGTLTTDNRNAPPLEPGYGFGHRVGGLIGLGGNGDISIDDCYAHVKIAGQSYENMSLGGLFGFMNLNAGERFSCHNSYCRSEIAHRELTESYRGYQGLYTSITEGHFTENIIGSSGAILDFKNVGFFDDDWFWKLQDMESANGGDQIETEKYKLTDYSTKTLFEDVLNYSEETWKIQNGYYPVFNGESSVSLPSDYLNEWLFYDESFLSDKTLSGKCGDSATWSFKDATLTISGTGDIYDYHDPETGMSCSPWKDLIFWTRKIVIEEGITGIGRVDFYDNWSVRDLFLPSTLSTINDGAFLWNYRLDKVHYAGSEADWNTIRISGSNEDLLQADFTFEQCNSLTIHEAHDATCTEPGNITYWTCSKCGRFFSDESAENEIDEVETIVEATGHDWTDGRITKEPAAGKEGEMTYTCSICGETYGELIPALAEEQAEAYEAVDAAEAATNQAQQKAESIDANSSEQALADADKLVSDTASEASAAVEAAEAAAQKAAAEYGEGSEASVYAKAKLDQAKQIYAKAMITAVAVKAVAAEAAVQKAENAQSNAAAAAVKPGEEAVKAAQEAEVAAKDYLEKATAAKETADAALEAVVEAGYTEDSEEYKSAAKAVTAAETAKASAETRLAEATAAVTAAEEAKTKEETKEIVDLPKVTISKVVAGKKSATVKWKKVSKKSQKKISKIQIQYSTDKKFRTNVRTTTAKKTAVSKKISKLKKGKRYYFRIRSYKLTGGRVHVSKWSSVKNTKAK